MKHRKRLVLITIMVMALVLQIGMSVIAKPRQETDRDIVQVAQGNPQLTTLVKALAAADLVDDLQGAGPFTVFAPTDAAFDKLPKDTLTELLKPENKDKLADLLTYHVKTGKTSSEEALKLNGQNITMLNGKPAKIEVKDGTLYIDGAKVIIADVQAKNGVIHIIDTVMQP